MERHEIPEFVAAIIAAGSNICAIGPAHYCLGDDEETSDEVRQNVNAIVQRYGERSHLLMEIVQYLQLRGRAIDIPAPDCSMLFAGIPIPADHRSAVTAGE
ncbi:hypothetical protein LJR030_002029 [Rhizobium sp. LjRoot30]|uniref:hypothetical protein n=1 Tax=Rhizobium sp. LjRoot30 TaxID=3342320 RepID=UPI003ECD97C7